MESREQARAEYTPIDHFAGEIGGKFLLNRGTFKSETLRVAPEILNLMIVSPDVV